MRIDMEKSCGDGILRGFNTDMDGFLEPIKRKEFEIKNSKIL